MIEFYHRHFKSNYTTKVKQLISDIERLLYLENIPVDTSFKEVLDPQFRLNLNINLWEKVNCLYKTLYKNSGKIP
jgi:glutamine synthetase type III